MRGLTGAPLELLPTGSGKTTATRTTFKNDPSKRAKAIFYTTSEFEEIINDYIGNLNKDLSKQGWETFPKWDSFNKSITVFCSELKTHPSYDDHKFTQDQIEGFETKIDAKDYFATFSSLYVDKCSDYSPVLDSDPKSFSCAEIMAGQLIPYVSYKNFLTDDDVTSCKALGVKEVIVQWPLFASDTGTEPLGKIALVDTMGIGEPKFSVEKDLLNIIKERADLAISLCKIENDQDDFEAKHDNDKRFLKVLRELRDRLPQHWVYYAANKHANSGITEDVVRKFKNRLWTEMQTGTESFSLNKDYFEAFEFMLEDGMKDGKKKYKINSPAIKEYFITTVLSHLEDDIEKIDKYFIDKAEDVYDNAIRYRSNLINLFTNIDACSLDVSDEDTELDKATDTTLDVVLNAVIAAREQIMQENQSLCDKIMETVYPLLCEPEVYKLYGIKIPKDNLFADKIKSGNSTLNDTRFREVKIFIILNELNLYITRPENHNAKFEEAKNFLLSEIEKNEKVNSELSYYEELLKKPFFEEIFEQTKQAIANSVYQVTPLAGSKINPKKESTSSSIEMSLIKMIRNDFGRELQYFYRKREDVLQGILERLDTTASKNANQDLVLFFQEKTKSTLNLFCKAIYDALKDEGLVQPVKNDDYVKWYIEFINNKGKHLQADTEVFLNTRIDLNKIVTEDQADKLLESLYRINLRYNSPKDAAYCFFASLFVIDRQIRYSLWEMYTSTFESYGIYYEPVQKYLEKVFCINSAGHTKSDAFMEFRKIIRNIKKDSFANSDDGKLVEIKKSFNTCFDEMKSI